MHCAKNVYLYHLEWFTDIGSSDLGSKDPGSNDLGSSDLESNDKR